MVLPAPLYAAVWGGEAPLRHSVLVLLVALLSSLSLMLGVIDYFLAPSPGAFTWVAGVGLVGYGGIVRMRSRREAEGRRFLFEERQEWVAPLRLAR